MILILLAFFGGKNFSGYSDTELLQAYRATSKNSCLGELYKRYTHLVFGVCMKYLKNEEDARDMVMEIFEKLLISLKEQEVMHFSSWLYIVSRNACLMWLRKQKRNIPIEKKDDFMESAVEMHLTSKDNTEKKLNALELSLKMLKEEQRRCIELFYLGEKSYQEVADITGYTMNEVKSNLQNGKRNLKILMAEKA